MDIITQLIFRARDEASSTINEITGAVGGLVKAFVAFQGASAIKSFADIAARGEVLGTVLNVIGNNAGIGASKLNEMVQSVTKLGVTARSATESLTKMIQAGLITEDTAYRAGELANVARNAAVISGQNTSEVLRDLITNIQQLDVQGLRYRGIVTSLDEAQRKFAATLGVSANSLTQAQRQQALFNAVVEEGVKIEGAYEAAMGDVGKQISSLARLQEEASISMGQTFLPVYSALIEVYTDLLKAAKSYAEELKTSSYSSYVQAAAGIRQLTQEYKEQASVLRSLAGALSEVAKFWILFVVVPAGLLAFFKALVGISTAATSVGVILTRVAGPVMALFTGSLAAALTRMQLLQFAAVAMGNAIRAAFGLVSVAFLAWNFGTFLRGFDSIRNAAEVTIAAIMLGWGRMTHSFFGSLVAIKKGWTEFLAFIGYISEEERVVRQKALDAELVDLKRQLGIKKQLYQEAGTYDSQGGLLQEAEALARELLAVESKLLEVKLALADLKKSGADLSEEGKEKSDKLQAEIQTLDAQRKELAEKFTELVNSVRDFQLKEVIKELPFELRVDRSKIIKSFLDAQNVIAEASKTIGLQKIQFEGNFQVSADFSQLLSSFEKLKERFNEPLTFSYDGKVVGEVQTSLRDLQVAFDLLRDGVKSPEEITLVLAKMGEELTNLSARIRAFRDQMVFDREKLEMDRLANMFSGVETRIATLRKSYDILKDVQLSMAQSNADYKNSLLELGIPFYQVNSGVISLFTSLRTLRSTLVDTVQASAAVLQQNQAGIVDGYRRDLETLSAMAKQKEQVLRDTYKGGFEETMRLLSSMRELERDTVAKRITINQDYFAKLKALGQDYLSNYKTLAERVKALDEEIYQTKKTGQQEVRALLREQMTEEEALMDRKRELYDLEKEASFAVSQGNYDAAKEFYRDAIAMAKELASSSDENDRLAAIFKVKKLYEELGGIQETERQKTRVAAESQLQAYQKISQELGKLAGTLEGLVKEQELLLKVGLDDDSLAETVARINDAVDEAVDSAKLIKVEVDSAALQQAVDRVRSAFAGIKIEWAGDGRAKTFAGGGYVRGPGTSTSDSILAFLSNEEYVVKASAVRKVGLGFMHALNEGALDLRLLPRFATGGQVTKASASSAAVSVPRDVVEIVVRDKGQDFTLEGTREDAAKLVRTLRGVGRGRG